MNEVLTEDNFIKYAMRHYDNPQCTSIEEFEEDLKRFNYLHKLLIKYRKTGILRERLIINHIVVIYNVFGLNATNMLFHKIDEPSWRILITFLVYLGHMPDKLSQYSIELSEIELDQTILETLKNL